MKNRVVSIICASIVSLLVATSTLTACAPKTITGKDVRIVCWGDSLTAGAGGGGGNLPVRFAGVD